MKQRTQITNITRRQIFDLISNGFEEEGPLCESIHNFYPYYGIKSEHDFLADLYDLHKMPSKDKMRFKDADEEFAWHSIMGDSSNGWLFQDDRLELLSGDDETLLRFILHMFDPNIRDDKQNWRVLFDQINKLLTIDGYVLYETGSISNHSQYGWKIYSLEEGFLPFSLRHKDEINSKSLKITLPKELRKQIYMTIQKFNECQYRCDNGYNYNYFPADYIIKQLSQYYEPKCYNKNNEFLPTNDLQAFIEHTTPYWVFDAIEIFTADGTDELFIKEINSFFNVHNILYRIENGKIVPSANISIRNDLLGRDFESGVKKLIQEAMNFYNSGNKALAVEKVWDAFERVKTIYCAQNVDKKASVNILIKNISNGNTYFSNLFNEEFVALTNIGNKCRIRHHETDKVEIESDCYYEYFYSRCVSLLNLVMNFIKH